MSRSTLKRPNLYDYLKVVAIIAMIIDHVGYFLYPDQMRFRVIGRIAFPLFFLLIGRNQSGKIGWSLMIAAIAVQGTLRFLSATQGYDLWQLNILPAAILTKIALQYLPKRADRLTKHITSYLDKTTHTHTQKLREPMGRIILMIICIVAIPYTYQWVDYGSIVLCTAIAGTLIKRYYSQWQSLFIPVVLCLRGWININHVFPFHTYQWIAVYGAWIISIGLVWKMSYQNITMQMHKARDHIVLWLSNYAVRVYIIHFLGLLAITILKN